MENKEGFVKELGELLHKFGVEDVKELEYQRTENDEIVIIKYKSGHYRKVNVHMDSLAAIVRDVMRVLQ